MRRDVLDICLLIFIADVVTGVQTPLFPLYTTSLGASLGVLGLITAVLGLTRLASALPIGMLSDRLDRKTVLVGGMVAFAISFALYALAPNAGWLVLPRVVQALAMVATFPLGIAYIGDIVETRDRGAAIGVTPLRWVRGSRSVPSWAAGSLPSPGTRRLISLVRSLPSGAPLSAPCAWSGRRRGQAKQPLHNAWWTCRPWPRSFASRQW